MICPQECACSGPAQGGSQHACGRHHHLLCAMCMFRFEEYVPRKKRREEEEAKLLRLQGVSVPVWTRVLRLCHHSAVAARGHACVHTDHHQPTFAVSTHLTLLCLCVLLR